MTRDAVVLVVFVVAFATLWTAHVMLAIGLAGRPPRWRALVALVVVPLAPWWGWREGMRARASVWMASAIVVAMALRLALS